MHIKFISKGVLCVLGLITVGAMSTSAIAQSAEYRRGYDQGYRDGIDAQDRPGQQEGAAARIIIEQARYGTRDAACDIREKVQQAVGRQRNISITANNSLCDDPAPNRVKQLVIRYHCDDGPTLRVQAREGSTATLSCR